MRRRRNINQGGVETTTFLVYLKKSKRLYEAYKKQYMSNPFDSTTIDTGNELISKIVAENKEMGRDDHIN